MTHLLKRIKIEESEAKIEEIKKMAVINSDNRQAWQNLANEAGKNRPSVDKRVKIVKGRKHKGKEGIVIRHIRDQYDTTWRYCPEASAMLREMNGRSGYVIQVRTESNETFWVKADYSEILEN